ncbi:dihydrofolate reductase [Fusarium heterosporum]|uniref:Dihydrofolate reductase n=1 Tax=Fusarium heterosporum TaxID=42747 RepID=A0A8H5THD8_FUSHE|nr:dihydrofolate reductase [Fusarium heterosporum]
MTASAAPKPSGGRGKKEVKILMLHGYTQSGTLFRAKTRSLEKTIVKLLNPISLLPVFLYATGPNRLSPEDIPGYQPPEEPQPEDYQPDTWAWWRKDEATEKYRLLDEGMATIAEAIRDADGIDAVCGFSQGAAMAALVTAALEPERVLPEGQEGDWARGLRDANSGNPLKFSVMYSGFWATPDSLQFCFEPKIKTPSLHFLGSLDTVVEENRSRALTDRCQDPLVLVHPGGHHVPVAKQWAAPLAGFIKEHGQDKKPEASL